MGKSYWFECSKCGYRAKVSGGPDRGLDLVVQTILCQDCKQLYDAVTRLRWAEPPKAFSAVALSAWKNTRNNNGAPQRPPTFEAALNRLRVRATARHRWIRFPLQCPVSAHHRIKPWKNPDKCPRCHLLLEKNGLPFRIWD